MNTNLAIEVSTFPIPEVGFACYSFGVIQWELEGYVAGTIMCAESKYENNNLVVHVKLCYKIKRSVARLLKGQDVVSYPIGLIDVYRPTELINEGFAEMHPLYKLKISQKTLLTKNKERIRYKTEFWFICECGRKCRRVFFTELKGFVCNKCGNINKDHPVIVGKHYWYDGEVQEAGVECLV